MPAVPVMVSSCDSGYCHPRQCLCVCIFRSLNVLCCCAVTRESPWSTSKALGRYSVSTRVPAGTASSPLVGLHRTVWLLPEIRSLSIKFSFYGIHRRQIHVSSSTLNILTQAPLYLGRRSKSTSSRGTVSLGCYT